MLKFLSPLAASILLAACAAPADKPVAAPDAHTSRSALDWQGSYGGVLPCADCPGIEMKLTLNADGSYTLSRRYQDRQAQPEHVSGRFHWLPGNGTIELEGEGSRWRVGENQLSLLDADGKVITGALAEHYILRRVTP
ncbi:copper resistance protein NlpE [Bordetella genomosp. 12]|uniref:Copper homeostasis protein n=1 Tax=Bordetella genomosp. 12 TaxID=463035 RepID=A0A261VD69_9BORD|nr:copper resistance protein NlpE [Bordetella genomosp. 12]OZI71103.1 hypothetical protein CAL22_14625 [Bordetella genomosp. 12]